MEQETAHIWKKLFHRQILSRFINYCTLIFFLFAGDGVKTNGSGLYFCKVFW